MEYIYYLKINENEFLGEEEKDNLIDSIIEKFDSCNINEKTQIRFFDFMSHKLENEDNIDMKKDNIKIIARKHIPEEK